MAGQYSIGFIGFEFMEKDIAPGDFTTMRLQLNRSAGEEWVGAIEEVLHPGMIDDQLIIEPHAASFTDQTNADLIHSPNGLSAKTRGSLPGAPGLLFQSPPLPLSAPSENFSFSV